MLRRFFVRISSSTLVGNSSAVLAFAIRRRRSAQFVVADLSAVGLDGWGWDLERPGQSLEWLQGRRGGAWFRVTQALVQWLDYGKDK